MSDLTPDELAELEMESSRDNPSISGEQLKTLLGMLAEREAETIGWKRIADQRLTEALEYAENEGVLLDSIKGLESERDAALAEVERLRAYALDADVRLTETTIEHDDALAEVAALRERLGAVKKVAERAIRVAKECGEAPDHIAYLRDELSKGDPR